MNTSPLRPELQGDNYLHLFQETTRLITSTLKVDRVLKSITRKIPAVVGVDAATIRLLDPTGTKLILLAAHGLSREYLEFLCDC